MIAAFLYLNAAFYAVSALWCLLKPDNTSSAIGYLVVNDSGRCEYLTVYGGLQLGLGVFFALCAYIPGWALPGLGLTASLYLPVVSVRWISIGSGGSISGMTYAIAGLETLMALAVAALVMLSFRGG